MGETPDIVEVLQRWASDYDDSTWQQPATLTKAAAEIVRLRSLVERLLIAAEDCRALLPPERLLMLRMPTGLTYEARAALEANDA